jgi:hypothetical protein
MDVKYKIQLKLLLQNALKYFQVPMIFKTAVTAVEIPQS